MRRSPRAHYVRHNAVTRLPRAYVYLDTETHRTRETRSEVQSFRIGVAAFDARRHDSHDWKERDWHTADAPADLWEWIVSRCRAKARTVLVAHNLAFDLRISDAFRILPELGWRCVFIRLDDGQASCIWKAGNRTLVMVDSMSWTPLALERLGELVGIGKLELPDEDDSDEAWRARCVRDVEILADVWRRLMAWIELDDLGQWKPTGAGQSWQAFRHRFMTHQLLVHEDDEARDAERESTMTGRCEAWRHGTLDGGPFVEWDYITQYARIGVECSVPIKLAGELNSPTLANVLRMARTRAVLCQVEVTTDAPTLACRMESGISWPVGTFRTTVWENELELALANGATVTIERAWVYRRAPALAAFCGWVLAGLDPTTGNPDPIVRVALKHWSRSLIGRTAAQWSRWHPIGSSPTPNVSLGTCHDASTGESFRLLQLGCELSRADPHKENPDAMVSVMAWVMAEARVRLWGVMERAGFDHVVYVDTDSVIVDAIGDLELAEAALPGLRVKSVWQSLEVLGPRQIVPGGRLRASGVPRGSVLVAPHVWEGEVWSGLSRSLSTGEVDSVRVARRRFRLRGTDNRRRHLADGSTVPFELELASDLGSLTA